MKYLMELTTKEEIDALISDEVMEVKTLEYKEELPGNSDSQKKEFLSDVSSFANALGGSIIYGVVERRDENGKPTGIPERVKGLPEINIDQEILRLEHIIRNGIDPRIPGTTVYHIDGFDEGPVIIIYIPKSWISPHMVTYDAVSRFFSRTSSGKYPLDIREIRAAFALSETLTEKIRRFRDDRLSKIIADETPVKLQPSPKIVLHIVPISSLEPTSIVELNLRGEMASFLELLGPGGSVHRYNFDGILAYGPPQYEPDYFSYLQLFRSGAIEAVNASLIRERGEANYIPSIAYEEQLIIAVNRYLELERYLGIEPPIFIMIALHGVKDYIMYIPNIIYPDEDEITRIDRDTLILPEITANTYEARADHLLRPVFDAVWQAAGHPKSRNYDDNGNWVGQR